ncbi:uncharacterized protein N7458_003976 [Penicillium daleae]|uniref:Uncharacterized protein n=1 Tax=Penicillium daleae TaxID=63821 RepID=A0AAD6C9N9_9EURO|nr:uncharacterized protein N7458_003976 [Penicillium daleae]KAJ5455712.1 hypothetical protein N7458_003976 [Penicillium daleae]
MADTKPTTTEPSEPTLDTMTWVEVTQHAEEILERFQNDETTFQRWEVKVVWEYWRGFEMMGLNPKLSILKFMQDVVIPFATSRVQSRLQCYTRHEKAIGADKSKAHKIETSVDEGPAVVYRKGSSPETAAAKKAEEVQHVPRPALRPDSAVTRPSPQLIQWDLGAYMRANTATRPSPPQAQSEHIEDATQSSFAESSSSITSKDVRPISSSPAPFHRVPLKEAAENILKSPISNSKLITQGPHTDNGFPAALTSRVEGHPELIKIVCNNKEEIVNVEDLVANNYLLRSTVESLNTTATSMQAIIEAQKDRIDALSGYIASQHEKIKSLTDKLTLAKHADK